MTYLEDYLSICPRPDTFAAWIHEVISARGTVYLFGNGGGHAVASHWRTDFTKAVPDAATSFSAPATNAAVLSMAANDYGWDHCYEALLTGVSERDAVIGFSASGTSEDILRALSLADRRRARVFAFFGVAVAETASPAKAWGIPLAPDEAENVWTVYGHQIARALR